MAGENSPATVAKHAVAVMSIAVASGSPSGQICSLAVGSIVGEDLYAM